MINGVPASIYPLYRDKAAPFLANFAKRSLGRWTADGIETEIMDQNMQLWSINDFQAVCVTSIGPESVNINFCAGIRRHEWQEALDDELREWAKALGKKRIIALVRPGWFKFGKARGYREAHREMVIEV